MSNFTLSSLKNTFDEVRSQYYPKNETEKKVYDVLSQFKNWGASSTQLNELASDSMDYDKYKIINGVIWQILESDGRSWKQIFKTLTLIEFLIKNGSERFIEECRDKMYKIRSFQDFNYYEGTIEKASGIREKSRQIVELLGSNELIRSERDKARQLRNKFVGIDSRNAGYSGGGSGGYYGGGGGGNFDNDRGGSSYDRGGRYGDSFSSDSHNRRASTGSDNHHGTGHGRYGGGAYDSDRPNRYNDDVQEDRQNFREETREKPQASRYTDDDFNEEPPAHKPTSATHRSKSIAGPSSTTTATGGKLKVTIKKAEATHNKPAPAVEKNLLDTGDVDFFSSDAPRSESFDAFTSAPSNNTAAFDPFGTAPAPANNTAPAFDPFGTSAPAPAPVSHAPVFDPFAAPVPAPVAVAPSNAFPFNASVPAPVNQFPPANNFAQNNFGQNNFPPAQLYPSNNAFPPSSIPLAPAPVNNNYGNNQFVQPIPAPATNNFVQSPAANKTGTFSHDAEFGDFEGPAQNNNNKAAAANNDKWGDLGKLVDLGKIEKNTALAAKQNPQTNNNNNYNNSFAGLDGFSKTPQSMNSTSAVRPIGSYANNAQPLNAMGAPRPMGGAPVPSYGAPMGAPMGNPGAAPYGAPMGGAPGYGQGGFGGYPAPGYPPAGAPMGNPGYGAPANPYMGNPNMYNAPNPNYGNPQYGAPRGW